MSLAVSARQSGDSGLDDLLIGRRNSTRHPVKLIGRFVTHELNLRIQLEDISATGACFRLFHARPVKAGMLRWLDFAVFGDLAWQREDRCGLQFAEPLGAECLRATLDFANRIARDPGDSCIRLAAAMTHGPGDY